MKYIYASIIALLATTGYGYETLVPQYYGQPVVVQQVQPVTQVMVYYAPYFTVTIPVSVIAPVSVSQPVQQTVYWGYPYQPVVTNTYWHHRCRLFNFNY